MYCLSQCKNMCIWALLFCLFISQNIAQATDKKKEYPSVFNWKAVQTNSMDSIPYPTEKLYPKYFDNRIVIPVSMMAMGGLLWNQRGDVKEMRDNYMLGYKFHIDDYMQYAPGAIVYGLNALGIEGHHTVKRATVSLGASVIIMGVAVNALKYTVKEPRPDGSASNSFPSGHTAMAFTMATFLHKEYGLYRSPIYSMVGYALAGATGIYRVLNNKHWISDVMFGAGIGILSTEAGYALTQCMMGDKGTRSLENRKQKRYHSAKPHFTRIYIGRTMPLGLLNNEESPEIYATHGVEYGMKAGYFLNTHWGIGGEMNATSFWMQTRRDLLNAKPELMGSASVYIGPAYSTMVGKYCRFDADLLGGYWVGAKNKITSLDPEDTIDGVPLTITWKPSSSFGFSTSASFHRMIGSNFGLGVYGRYAMSRPAFKMESNQPQEEEFSEDLFNWQQWSVGLSLTGYLW
ncbi:phosphatase PAP2 family protein [Halosquirtibacter laminarini]|uniref:Phosphatase PAP2 family protein n=1 Tax=Halosquirtibacter laminarini TaxID=3374600 RepID=A0AC61NDM7_9BACT|nr:phosphatase PAP2 family protein [Prolixibacteraceae bacterium]